MDCSKSQIEVFENSISRLEEIIDIQLCLINTEKGLNDLTKPTRYPEKVQDDDTQQEDGNEGPWRLPKHQAPKTHRVLYFVPVLRGCV